MKGKGYGLGTRDKTLFGPLGLSAYFDSVASQGFGSV
jgi:hypothetical protein